MIEQHSSSKFSLVPFLGIALADILANGVAIIMLLIVVTISSKYQLEQEKLEQVDEIAQVLSRDIASSVVMNNLSASAPAVLHDYEKSAIDLDARHAIMPILQILRTGVRDYYSGHVWSREDLLLQDNSFDAYLDKLDQNQMLRVRTDVYHIDLFYIYMSILKDHKIIPRHWHFAIDKSDMGQNNVLTGIASSDDWTELFGEDNETSDSDATNGLTTGQGEHSTDIYHPGNDLSQSDYPWDALGSEELQTQGDGFSQALPSQLRFRLATPDNQMQLARGDFQFSDNKTNNLLAGILSYLKYINEILEKDGSVVSEIQNILPILQGFINQPLPLSTYEQEIIKQISQAQLRQQLIGRHEEITNLTIQTQVQAESQILGVAMPSNMHLGTLKIFGNATQEEYLSKLPKYGTAYFHLQQYPELFQGLSLELLPNSIMLLADYLPSNKWRWYPVIFIYPEFDDFVMGFIYAKIPQQGQVVLAAESNRLTIGGYSLHLQRTQAPTESENLLVIFFGVTLIMVLLIYSLLLWRRR